MWENLQTKHIPYQTCENSFKREISWVKSHVGGLLTELKVLFNLRSILNLKDVRILRRILKLKDERIWKWIFT